MIFQNFNRKLFLLLLAAAGMAGCVQEYGGGEIPTPGNGNDVTITVNIPGQQIPTTRAMDDVQQAKVESIDILVFKPDGSLEKHVEGKSIGNIVEPAEGEAPTTYKVQFKATLPVSTDARTVVIVANADIPATVAEGDSKQTVLAALTHSSTGPWNTGATPDYIPMYGEAAVDKITSGMKIENIELTRMLVRIDVVNNATASFKLTDVYVVNHNTKGYIEPKWDGSKPLLNIPTDAYPLSTTATESDALTYSNPSGITSLLGEIYTYEAAATSGIEANPSHTNAICLIVKGKWLVDNKEYYYRIDFTAAKGAGQKPEDVQYMPVYRNHLYTFTIGTVNGVGYGSFAAALNSLGVLNNLKTNLHTVDMSGIKYMVFNGQHYIGLGDAVTFGYEKDLEAKVPCVTNYWEGWSIEKIAYEIGSGSDWLTATPSGDKKEVILKTESENTGINTTITDRVAYVHVKAGRLTHQLKVMQTAGESFTITVAPSSLTLPYTAVNGAVAYCLTVSCKDSQGNPANLDWTLTSGDDTWFKMSLSSSMNFASSIASVSGTGTQSVYVYATKNASATANRTTSITLSSTTVVNVRQDALGGSEDRITWDSAKQQYAITTDPRDAGLYFKYGSVVGVYSDNHKIKDLTPPLTASSDTFDVGDIPWNLTNVTGSGSAAFRNIPFTNTKDEINKAYHNITNVKSGKGDPCRLVGLDLAIIRIKADAGTLAPADIDNGTWRLPTLKENQDFCGKTAAQSYSLHWRMERSDENMFYGVAGGEFPARNTDGIPRKFLPAAGYRVSDGTVSQQGSYGYYRSTEADPDRDTYGGGRLGFNEIYIMIPAYEQFLNSSQGNSVRCVRQ